MQTHSNVVVDASIAVSQVFAVSFGEEVDALWKQWAHIGVQTCAPQLWANEVTSAIHKLYVHKLFSQEQALSALEAVLALGVELHPQDAELCRQAFAWATQLQQTSAYDGFYVALAQRLQADFWTADERLANRAQQVGAHWVHWIGEPK